MVGLSNQSLAACIVIGLYLAVPCEAFGIHRGFEKLPPLLHHLVAKKETQEFPSPPATISFSPSLILGSIFLFPSLADASGDVTRGGQVFEANCASCHAGGINVIKEKRTLKKDALDQFIGGYNEETIQAFLRESSRHQNQAYFRAPGGKLSQADFDDAASYVSQTATADAW